MTDEERQYIEEGSTAAEAEANIMNAQVAAYDAGLITFKQLTKQDFPVVAQSVADRLLEQTDALTAYVSIKQVENIADETLKLLKEKATLRFQGREMTVLGAKVTSKRAVEYDYSQDSEWRILSAKIEDLKAQLKAREMILKAAAKTNSVLADRDTGEISEGAQMVKNGMSIVVQFQNGGLL